MSSGRLSAGLESSAGLIGRLSVTLQKVRKHPPKPLLENAKELEEASVLEGAQGAA